MNIEELEQRAIDPGPDKIIGPGLQLRHRHRQDRGRRPAAHPENSPPMVDHASSSPSSPCRACWPARFWLFYKGVGVWGIMIPVAWGFAIVNFVWWIGIGHAGTLISAILLLLKQDWRTSINRFSEAMTLFAVAQAGMFPILHLGPPLARLLADSLSQLDVAVAPAAQPAALGRVRRHHLPDRLPDFLVHRPYPRPGQHARSRQEKMAESSPSAC